MAQKNKMSVYEKLSAIGVEISSAPYTERDRSRVDIEDAILDASQAVAMDEDSRILGLMLSWIAVHGEMVNVEKLKKMMKEREGDVSWTTLFAFFGLSCGQTRWRLLAAPLDGLRASGPLEQARIRAEFRGEEEWSRGSGFLIPSGAEQITERHISTQEKLAKKNRQYRNRLIYGPSWRADIITSIENGARTAAEISHQTGASHEPAHRILRDLKIAGKIRATA